MNIASTSVRRILTVFAVAASLVLGLGAIRASAAWTATAAPMSVAPLSVDALQGRLADESDRSAALVERLTSLTTHADELATALAAAEARIGQDAGHAAELATDLAAARKKLAALEQSIRDANRARPVVFVAAPTRRPAAPAVAAPRGDDGVGGDD